MFGDLASSDEIDRSVDRLLRAADAYGRFPTPVDDLVRAANLAQADDFVLDESFIVKAADHLRLLLRSAKRKIQGIIDRRARTEPRWVVGFEVILSAYTSLLSMAAIGSVSLVS